MKVLKIEDCDTCTQYPECDQVKITDAVENSSDPRGYDDVRSSFWRRKDFISNLIYNEYPNGVSASGWSGYDFSDVKIRGPLSEECMSYKFAYDLEQMELSI